MAIDVLITPGTGEIKWVDGSGQAFDVKIVGSATNELYFLGANTASGGFPVTGTLAWVQDLDASGNTTNSVFLPGISGYALGSSTYRWSVYGTAADFSGNVNISGTASVGGTLTVTTGGASITGATTALTLAGGKTQFPAATASYASFNLASSSGISPSSPVPGDVWWDGTNFNFYTGASAQSLVPIGTDTQTLRYSGAALVSTSSMLNNGAQIAVGGAISTSTRLSVNPQGASESALAVLIGTGNAGSALSINTPLGTGGIKWYTPATGQSPAITPKSGIAGGTTDLWVEGSQRIVLSPGYAVTFTSSAVEWLQGIGWAMGNHGYYISGATQFVLQTNINNTQIFVGGANSDTVLQGYGSTNAVVARGLGGQTRNIFEVQSAAGTVLGAFSAGGGLTNYGRSSVAQLLSPAAPTVSLGTNTAGTSFTYYYKVTAVSGLGETLASPESTAFQTASALSSSATLIVTWAAVAGAETYNVYRATVSGSELKAANVAATTYTDTGAAGSGAVPSYNSTGYGLFSSLAVTASSGGYGLQIASVSAASVTSPVNGALINDSGILKLYNSGWVSLATGQGLGIGNSITSSTSGSVLFVDSGQHLAQDNSYFFYNNGSHRLGVGITSAVVTSGFSGNNATSTLMVGPQGQTNVYTTLVIAGPAANGGGLQFADTSGNGLMDIGANFATKDFGLINRYSGGTISFSTSATLRAQVTDAGLNVSGAITQVGGGQITFAGYMLTNSTNAQSTTGLNPGILVYGGTTVNAWGMDLGYSSSNTAYRTRIFAPGDVTLSYASVASPTLQSQFTDVLTMRGAASSVGINTINPSAKLHVVSLATSDITAALQPATGQTGDILQVKDPTGSYAPIKVNGPGGANPYGLTVSQPAASHTYTLVYNAATDSLDIIYT